MVELTNIDRFYNAFCENLPSPLRHAARSLAFRLKLAPNPNVPWSQVFKHELTLGAPAFFAQTIAGSYPALVERALVAHMLAIIEAFATDRLADGQAEHTFEMQSLLPQLRAARNHALVGLGGNEAKKFADIADIKTRRAIARERRLLGQGTPARFKSYEAISADKQAVGVPASVALARAVGWSEQKVELVHATLMGIWLGLQFQDDVIDWEDDVANGGAWAAALALHRHADARPVVRAGQRKIDELKRIVFSTGVLALMLEKSAQQFQLARLGAQMLGADALVRWLSPLVEEVRELSAGEKRSAGYMVRLKTLQPWLREVLA